MICDLTAPGAGGVDFAKIIDESHTPADIGKSENTIMAYLKAGGEVHIATTKEKFKVLNFSLKPHGITVLLYPREGKAITQKNWDFLRIVSNFQNDIYAYPPGWYEPILVKKKE